jgi:alpha-galactosidase
MCVSDEKTHIDLGSRDVIMAIYFDENTQIFTLQTAHSTYQMKSDEYGFLLHLYYGARITGSTEYQLTYYDRGFSGNPNDLGENRTYSMDALPQEYPCYGNGDFRSFCFNMVDEEGVFGCDLRVTGHRITKGKYGLPKLPAVYAGEQEADTLEIQLTDARTGVEVTLYYGVLEAVDVITRAVKVHNGGDRQISITKVYSGCLDFLSGEFDILHFHGRHGMERNLERTPVIVGNQSFSSRRGTSSHQHNPFVILADKNTTEEFGACYGMSLLFSGNFHFEVEKDQFHQTRAAMGIMDEMFSYELKSGEDFYSPEVAFSYGNGLNELSYNFHRMIRDHVCRGKWKNAPRPILINNWEATYFDFNGEKIVQIAKQAAELGVDMLVLDDGWFGKRDTDFSGLGDWKVNERKLGGPLSEFVQQINDLGLKFGLWIEPEMVSEDSELYRTHPDWAFAIPGRKPIRGRSQLVLDFSRKEVVEEVFNQISAVIDSTNISYIKMDMNRSITDVYTATKHMQNQGSILYGYVLGVYEFIERLLEKYPDMLIEGCSGGGGRFDAGMLYYTPQIWCSDNTDAIERIRIQYGTSFGYPISAVGSHVSAVPNHQTGRITSIETRGVVAMAGSFGYELDLNLITDEEKEIVKKQIADCRKYWNLTHEGRYYRLTNPMTDQEMAAWEFVAEDKSEALVSIVLLGTHCNAPINYVHIQGLEEDAIYVEEESQREYSGSVLLHAGLPLPMQTGEYQSWQLHFKRVS